MLDPAAWTAFLDKYGFPTFSLVVLGVAIGFWFWREGWPAIKANQAADRAERAKVTDALTGQLTSERTQSAVDRDKMISLLTEQTKASQAIAGAMNELNEQIRGMRASEAENTAKILDSLSSLVRPARSRSKK